jgi:hypothetical protein
MKKGTIAAGLLVIWRTQLVEARKLPAPCGGLPPVACQTGSGSWRLLT